MPKINTLIYDFASGVGPWTSFTWTGADDQRASLLSTTAYPTALNTGHDAVDSAIFAQVWPAGGGGSGHTNTILRLRADSGNYAAILISSQGGIQLQVRDAGIDTYTGERAYNATTDAWLRIADSGNTTITASTSPDGYTWTVLGSLPHSWSAANVSVAFQAGHSSSYADDTMYVDNINVPQGQPTTPITTRIRSGGAWTDRTIRRRAAGAWSTTSPGGTHPGNLMFDANFGEVTSILDTYPDVNPETIIEGEDFGLMSDPNGSGRQVAWFDSWARKATSNGFPRASVCTDYIIKAAYHGNTQDEYWQAASVYLPETHKLTADGQWLSHNTQAFGPPYTGSSPSHMSIQPRIINGAFTGENIAQYNGRTSALGTSAIIPFDTWRYYLVHFKMAYDGWVEIFQWIEGSSATTWQRLPIDGITDGPAPIAPLKAGVNDAWVTDPTADACYTSVGVYGTEPRRLYYAHHRVGTTFQSVTDPANGWPQLPLPATA